MSSAAPPSTQWLADLMASQQSLLTPSDAAALPAWAGLSNSAMTPWLQAVDAFEQWQQQALQQMMSPWASPTSSDDKRFAGAAWHQGPLFEAMASTYLQQSALVQKTLAAAPLDARTKGQWAFVLRQVVDALSPANALATNPEALRTAVESGGASLAEGMRLFLQDLAKGRVSMSDDSAFEVGRNVATTPGNVVFENELMQLLQYAPTTARVHKRPLLIVPPCINKFYILDLQPDNSFVGHAVAQGHTVFLVSWRNIGPEQQHLGWDDYVDQGVMRAIDVARSISGADKVNTLGFCVGGTLLASTLAVMAAKKQNQVASMTLLTTMLDFADTGELGLLITKESVASHEASIGHGGLMRGKNLAQVFAALRANDLVWPYVVNSYLKGKAPPAFDLLSWNCDDTNLPGPMYCWYLRNTYFENKLREPGATVQCGVPVDLGAVGVPAFVYASREDHIVPWHTAYASTQLLGGDVSFVLGGSGHIAGVINPPAKKKRNHWVGDVKEDAADWLASAQDVPGSWWPRWSDWLKRHAGAMVAAPRSPGSRHYPPTEAAPGRYVKAKAP